jgi:hypothetical protein
MTRPSALTAIIRIMRIQAIVAASASMIDSAVMGTKYRQCHLRSVRRPTKVAPSLTGASVASSLLQVKTLLTPFPPLSTKSKDLKEHLALNSTDFVPTECMHSSGYTHTDRFLTLQMEPF